MSQVLISTDGRESYAIIFKEVSDFSFISFVNERALVMLSIKEAERLCGNIVFIEEMSEKSGKFAVYLINDGFIRGRTKVF